MGNVQASEQDVEEAEKGIVISARREDSISPQTAGTPTSKFNDLTPDAAAAEEQLVFTEIPPPPDGGYGWVIVVASFICNMVVDGIAYSFGVLLPALVAYFDESVAKVAWVGSLLTGVYLLAGPLVSALTNVYGFRPVCITGSILAAASVAISTTVVNVSQMLVVYGILGGIGMGMVYLPAIVAVNYYFEKRRALATGIAVCGSGVGTFLFAPLTSYLVTNYGWKATNLTFGGIILACALCGAFMRPLIYKQPKTVQTPLLQLMAEEKMREMKRGSVTSDNYFLVKLADGSYERRPKWKMNHDPGVHSSLALNECGTGPGGLPTIAEASRTGGSSSPEEARAVPQTTREYRAGSLLRPPQASVQRTTPESQSRGTSLPTSAVDRTRIDEDSSEKSSDSEKNDIVPELPLAGVEERCSSRRGSKKTAMTPASRRGSMPISESSSSLSMRETAPVKNTSTPLFTDSQRRSSAGLRSATPSNNSLSCEMRRLSAHNRHSISVVSGGTVHDEELWLCSLANVSAASRSSRGSVPRAGDMLRPMSRRDIFYSGSIRHLTEYHSQRSIAGYRASVFSLPQDSASRTQLAGSPCCTHLGDCSVLQDMLDTSLLKSPLFMLICLSNVLGMLGFYVPFVYLVDSAVDKGISSESAAFLLSVIGITNTLGRVGCGYITDFPSVDALSVSNVCILLSGLCTLVIPLCHGYVAFVFVAVVFGFAIASFIALTSVILVDLFGLAALTHSFGLMNVCRGVGSLLGSPLAAGYVALTSVMLVDLLGIEKLSNSFGLLILFRGLSSVVGPPVAGALYDATGDYDVSFYTAGVLLVLASVCGFLVPLLRSCLSRTAVTTTSYTDHVAITTSSPSFVNISDKDTEPPASTDI